MNPENLQSDIAKRLRNLEAHNSNPELQTLALAVCSKDIVQWVNDWVWTYDPRLDGVKTIPMKLFPEQEKFLLWLEEREQSKENGLLEKSRDTGATWLCVAFLVHRWLFSPGFKGSIGSRTEDLVDKLGDPDTIFEKIRAIVENLPKWMLPLGFNRKQHDLFCRLKNPENGAVITGEGGKNLGRGGRSSVYFLDEAAFVEQAEMKERALSQNTRVRIDLSTPNGNGNPFAKKRFSGKTKVFTLHWKSDPRKNAWELVCESDGELLDYGLGGTPPPDPVPAGCRVVYPWYEAEKDRLQDPVTIAQELDIDYTASVGGLAIPAKWVRSAVNLHKRVGLPKSDYVIAGLDVADGGVNESVLVVRRGIVIEAIYSRNESGTTDTANWALDNSLEHSAKYLNYDAPGVGSGIAGHFKARERTKPLGLIASGINTGAAPTDTKWPDGRTAKEKFSNLKAELWWVVRRRFEKTYEFVEEGKQHPLEELISIPDHPTLIQQLSNVKCDQLENGKIVIETKKQLDKRGVASPDHADALILSFAPTRKRVRMAAGGKRDTFTPR